MDPFQIFQQFMPMRNPVGFGASDFVVLALAVLAIALLSLKPFIGPYVSKMAGRTLLSMCLIFGIAVLLRLALVRQSPVPIPSGADDFSYILLGDTLRHFRLANAPHQLPQFFEAVFILQEPAYASIYPLGQGFVLAFGELLLHSPWAGVLISSGVFAALCYWMLRAWVAPVWAFAGGMLAIFEFGPLNPWVNSYWGGLVSAIAGCLVFGSLPRLRKSLRMRNGTLLGAGLALQILTRPFEAVFLAVSVVLYIFFTLPASSLRAYGKPALAASCVIATSLGLVLLQNRAVSHDWTTMPYMLSRYQYGVPATLTFQANAVPHRQMTAEQELDYRAQAAIHGEGTDSAAECLGRLTYRFRYLRFFLLPPLYFAVFSLARAFRQRPYIWAAATVLLFALGTNFYAYFYPQYIAAVTCLFVLFSVRGLEQLPDRARTYVGLLCCASFIFWFGIYLSGNNNLVRLTDFQSWYYINRGDPQGRAAVQDQLTSAPGRQLVFVRYSTSHRFEEWIHNDAEIDKSQTVWANDLGVEENQKLLRYYPHRTAWLLEPDAHPPALEPYPSESGPFLTVH